MENVILKEARRQRFQIAILYFVLPYNQLLYIMCGTQKIADTFCRLAFLPSWSEHGIDVKTYHSRDSPVFGPCRPVVTILRAGWGRNRSPSGQGPCGAAQGRVWGSGQNESPRKAVFFLLSIPAEQPREAITEIQFAQPTVSYKNPPPWGRASRALVRRCRTAR